MRQPGMQVGEEGAGLMAVSAETGATARVHSLESCGLGDGPGIRLVVFLQGCQMRCRYCHNPDTWEYGAGSTMTVEDLVQRARRFAPFLRRGGGVTVGGGEPLLQRMFVARYFHQLIEEGFHTALDTNGFAPDDDLTRAVLRVTKLVLLDVKALPEDYPPVTGLSGRRTFAFLDLLTRLEIPTWIRHVVVPGLVDQAATSRGLAERFAGRTHIQRIDLLPFHRMGDAKYQRLGLHDPLPGIVPPDAAAMAAAAQPFRARGLPVRIPS